MTEFTIICHAGHFQNRSFVFPGGELQVQVPDLPPRLDGQITVLARLQSAGAPNKKKFGFRD
jgi:hypothetical protein